MDVKGKEIIPTKYNDLYRILEITNNDIYIIYAENGQYGLSKNGKNIIQNDYQSIVYNESCNVLIASKGKKYGVLSMEGKAIVPFLYKQIDVSGENIYATTTEGQVKVFNNEGKRSRHR